jgi:RNA polymerase sigma-54 factor
MLLNPVLEEVHSQDEVREISENIIDQMADGNASSDNISENGINNFEQEILNKNFTDLVNGSDEAGGETLNGLNGNGAAETSIANENFDEDFADENSDFGDNLNNDSTESNSGDSFEEIDYGREFQDYLDPGYRTQEIEHKDDAPSFEQFLTRQESLTEHLEWQLRLQPLDEKTFEIAHCIIGNLDPNGRLTASDEEIGAMCEATVELVEQSRETVLQLDPVGCGARDVRECLLVQLDAKGESDRLAKKLIRDHLSELQPHKLGHLAKEIGCEIADIKNELEMIRTLDPYPGRRYATEAPVYIAPEIYIEKIEGEYVVYFADDGSPRLRLSSTYQKMLGRSQTSKEERDFIKEKLRSAIDLLRNIEHRRQTIYRVVECIVERQHQFLDQGVQFLKPMMLKDVAEETGMHLSTISRVVNRKYAHTPQGVIELRRFFSEGMLNEDGEEVSTRIIKLRIKKLIEEEDSSDPVTDDYLAKVLAKEGIKLSRRTVAKYRDQMQIPGSRERKVV